MIGLDLSVLQIKSKIVICHAADSKPVKQEVKGTVILPPLVFPGLTKMKMFTAKLCQEVKAHPNEVHLS